MADIILIIVAIALIGIHHELRLIRRHVGGTLGFFPWNDK